MKIKQKIMPSVHIGLILAAGGFHGLTIEALLEGVVLIHSALELLEITGPHGSEHASWIASRWQQTIEQLKSRFQKGKHDKQIEK